eukprot:1027377-Lingulodinium_polyedra.AAC.1
MACHGWLWCWAEKRKLARVGANWRLAPWVKKTQETTGMCNLARAKWHVHTGMIEAPRALAHATLHGQPGTTE